MDSSEERKGQSVLCQKTVSSYRKMQDIPHTPPQHPTSLLIPHSCIQTLTNRVMTLLLHSTVSSKTQPYLTSWVAFFFFSLQTRCLTPQTLLTTFPWTHFSCEHIKTVLERSVFGLELSLRSVSMLCYPNCIKC